MSYIGEVLFGKIIITDITTFLELEGFKEDSGPFDEEGMVYIANGDLYTVWFTVDEDTIDTYVEFECGGHVSRREFDFKQGDFNSFKQAYVDAVDYAKGYILER